jgi:hypothetical protein
MFSMTCQERDKIILAFALAMNEGNNASSDLAEARSDHERAEALHLLEASSRHTHRLRALVLDHCKQHGC